MTRQASPVDGGLLTKREREVLRYAVIFGWDISYGWGHRGTRALWREDTTLPFRAHKTLQGLVQKGLMESVPAFNSFRATFAADAYQCRAHGCQRGCLYEEADDGYDRESGKCHACDGTGISLTPADWNRRATNPGETEA